MVDFYDYMSGNILFLGAGSWAIALSRLISDRNDNIYLYEPVKENYSGLCRFRESRRALPGIKIPKKIKIIKDCRGLEGGIDYAVIALPTQKIRTILGRLKGRFNRDTVFVSVSKGIEINTGLVVSGIIKDVLGPVKIAVLSGPTYAEEVAAGLPVSCVCAAENPGTADKVIGLFLSRYFRVYSSRDLMGVQIGGALKNVIAIASGISDGLALGVSTRAALITRGLAEIIRFGRLMGAKTETFSGLAGVGDLILTCTSDLSRNRRFGLQMVKLKKRKNALGKIGMVVEGVETSKAVHLLAVKHGVEMPITEQIYKILYRGVSPGKALSDLLGRSAKPEIY